MKIISWNVNGIRAVAKKWLHDFIEEESPDILCIQETKAFEDQFLKEVGELKWYEYIWHAWEKAWYAGTAIFWKKWINVTNQKNNFWENTHFYEHGRVTQIETDDFVLINGYFPNGWKKVWGPDMLEYKLEFYDYLMDHIKTLKDDWKNVIMTWDFNIVHTEIDIARPKENVNSIGFLPIEREKVSELLSKWYTDMFRHFYPDQIDTYSWWSYRAWARPRNVGWRIDYFVVNNEYLDSIKDIKYMGDAMWSDHCPVMLEL